ncbi:glycosyltransferase family 39 protein [Candidatus Roizmanbacteria bacterium]|nr:glycosyltransferase family 39 protein [Candidatus Roizmanbacteria bacterium]
MKSAKKQAMLLLLGILMLGFWFRLQGILHNHSFWQDEAFAADLARDIVTGNRTILQAIGLLNYQPLHVITLALSMRLFGLTEFAARLPSVIMGTLGIAACFLVIAELTEDSLAGLFGAFFFAFSQMNLTNATQAKPYVSIETLTLFIFFLLLRLMKRERNGRWIHTLIIILLIWSSLLHFLGSLLWLPYFLYLVTAHKGELRRLLENPKRVAVLLITGAGIFFVISGPLMIRAFFMEPQRSLFFPYNNITFFRELFLRQYFTLTFSALLEIYLLLKERRAFALYITAFLFIYLYLWIFKESTHNIRYLLPVFGVLWVLFANFWSRSARLLAGKKEPVILFLIVFIFFIGGNKIVRKPSIYYSPNADLYGDVQNADYKKAFSLLKIKYPHYSQITLFNNWGDAQVWYLSVSPTAYFMKGTFAINPRPYNVDGHMVYGSLAQFLAQKAKHPRGFLVVEDWESILPENIKQFAKNNMKLEVRVENLKESPTDKWPLEIYSWGL